MYFEKLENGVYAEINKCTFFQIKVIPNLFILTEIKRKF